MAYYASQEDVLEVTAMRVHRGHVEQTVTAIASGTVIPKQDSMLAAELLGTVARVHFEEGDEVSTGDIILELNHAELDAQVELAETNLRVGESRVQQAVLAANIYEEVAQTRVSQTAAQLEQARSDFERVKALADKNAISRSDYDKAFLALRVAQENAQAAQAGQRENLVRKEEIRSAEATLEQLRAAVNVAKATREKAYLRAPFPGTLAKIYVDVGEAVNMGLPVARLVHHAEIYVEAPFDEANAAQIALGQRVRINLDAYRSEDFEGRVDFIPPVVTTNMDLSRTLNVKIRVERGTEKFIGGMSADVIVLVDERDDVLFAPTESLIREQFAYVVEGGRAVRREVKTGVGNWSTVEVVEGLSEGELLVTSVALRGLQEGVRVHVTEEEYTP